MKLSYRWLGEMADLSDTSPEEVQRLLTFHTAEVGGRETVGRGLGDIVTGLVTAVRPHPDADKLRLCTVQPGEDAGTVEVVCGASNVAEGQVIAYAAEGTTLPGGPKDEPLTLTARKIRGVESRGMICSAREMGLGEDHTGILVLPEGTPLGIPFVEALAVEDTVFEVDNVSVTHRPDLWGHAGWARELAALTGKEAALPKGVDPEALPQSGEPFPISIDDEEGCRRYVGIVIEGLTNGTSPLPIRRRLEALGVRSIDLLVDLTNLVLLEQGQPLHAFDLRDVRGGEIRVRRAAEGETMTTLDGQVRALTPEDVVIADAEGSVAVAGVMGGEHSEIRADTTAILLESATFDPARIRRTAARLGLRTEASTRFEKNLDPELAMHAALRFTQLVLEHCPGARVSQPVSDCHPRPYEPFELDLPYALVRRRLGMRVPDQRVRRHLGSLGFNPRENGNCVRVRVPSWRATKDIERPEDLVEEVGRIEGYDRLHAIQPVAPMVPKHPRPIRELERRFAGVLSLELGYSEVKHRSFYGARETARVGIGGQPHLMVQNPTSEDHDRMVRTSAAHLLATVARNQKRFARGRLRESTRLFTPHPEGLPEELGVVGLAVWDCEDEDASPGAQVLSLVGDVRTLLRRLGVGGVRVENAVQPALGEEQLDAVWLHPGRTAVVSANGSRLAVVGEVLPSVARGSGLRGRCALAEVDADALLEASEAAAGAYEPVLRYPVVPFDVAVIVPRKTPAGEVEALMTGAVEGAIRDLHVFDVYEGEGIPEGHRSLALRCELFDRSGTLSTKAADALRKRITTALSEAGWTVRAG